MNEHPNISLRPVTDDDQEFLMQLFYETSQRTFGMLDLPSAQKEQILSMQLRARESGWRQANPEGSFDVIQIDGAPAGQWYTAETEERITLIYAALLEKFRGRHAVSLLTRKLMARADEARKPLCAHVEVSNPAQEIWLHLGFKIMLEEGAHYQLQYERIIDEIDS